MTSDIVIAMMGPTGSGKSHFIHSLTGLKEEKGANKLKSCTQDIREFKVSNGGGRYVLVDTPGFDDTYRSDRDILRTIADWLEKKYKGNVKLSGVIYTHRISDNRMSGSVCKNLDMFGRLCGDNAAKRVRLVTTMWDKVKDSSTAENRVAQLEGTFWKPLIDVGARHQRFKNTPESAWDIVRDATGDSETLLLQEELVDTERRLNETTAGQALYSQFQRLIQEQKDAIKQLSDEAKLHNDPALAMELEAKYKRTQAQLQETLEAMENMKIPWTRWLKLKLSSKKPRAHVIEIPDIDKHLTDLSAVVNM